MPATGRTDARPPQVDGDERATLLTFLGGSAQGWAVTMHATADETVEGIVAGYRDAVARADEVIAGYTDLGLPAPPRVGRGASPSMRWLLVHMIEETGRHAGHADILREQIDGATGR